MRRVPKFDQFSRHLEATLFHIKLCSLRAYVDPQIPLNQRCTGKADLSYNECEDPNAECKTTRDGNQRCLCGPNFFEKNGQCGTCL